MAEARIFGRWGSLGVWLGRLACVIALVLILGGEAYAQNAGEVAAPVAEWNAAADQAERTLAIPSTGDARLEEVRTGLVSQRSDAREALEPLRERATTLTAQLESIGPAPAEGESEPDEIAARRAELTEDLADARVPVVAVEAFVARADELIDQIDDIRRERFSEELTRRGPIPVMPETVADATGQAREAFSSLLGQIWARLGEDSRSAALAQRWPGAAALVILGLITLIFIRRRVTGAIGRRLRTARTPGQLALWGVALDLSRTMLPVAASMLLIAGLREFDPGVPALGTIIDGLPLIALVLIVAHWVGASLFRPARNELAILPAVAVQAQGHFLTLALGAVTAVLLLLAAFADGVRLPQTALAVLNFPAILVGSVVLFSLSRVLGAREAVAEEDASEGTIAEAATAGSIALIIKVLSWVGFVVAIISPVLALAGYYEAANFAFVPFVYSFLLIGALLVSFWLVRELIESWLTGGMGRAQADFRSQFRLLPVIFGMLLAIGAMPLLALIWGARGSDVQSAVTWLLDGVTVGETQVSASDFLVFALVFAVGYMLTRAIQSVFRNSVLPRTSADIGARTAIVSGIGYLGIFLAALAAISSTGLSLSNLAIVAGALSIGVGFGLQTIVSNFVSGIILLIERPIKLGDWIEVSGYSGYVRRISVRATEIETFDRASVILPNADLVANPVLNWTHASVQARVIVPVGVAYGTDPRKVEALLLEIAAADSRFVRLPAPSVIFQGFGADSMDFELRGILRNAGDLLSTRSDTNYAIVEKFTAEGIEIPFAQRDLNLRNPGALAEAIAQAMGRREN